MNKKGTKTLYFTHMPRSPSGWICTKFGLGCPPADVINCAEFCCNRLMSFDSVRGQKFAISHWLGQSPLTRCWRYRAACDPLHLPFFTGELPSGLKSEVRRRCQSIPSPCFLLQLYISQTEWRTDGSASPSQAKRIAKLSFSLPVMNITSLYSLSAC